MEVYVLVDDNGLTIGIFSSKEKAIEYAKKEQEYHNQYFCNKIEFCIHEWEVDNADNSYGIIDLDI